MATPQKRFFENIRHYQHLMNIPSDAYLLCMLHGLCGMGFSEPQTCRRPPVWSPMPVMQDSRGPGQRAALAL